MNTVGFCSSFGIENSFLSALGPKLDFLALGSYADVLAHCGGGVNDQVKLEFHPLLQPMRIKDICLNYLQHI